MSHDASTDFDVVVVGAGLSGIAAAHHLRQRCPKERFVILEGRHAIGGTWDLFRYPGVRSDSDMFTLGYSFRPWTSDATIAQGPEIRRYIEDTARAEGTLDRIRFGHRVVAAHWDSAQARWTLDVEAEGAMLRFTCRFAFFCSGYYDYAQGHAPRWPGQDIFGGRIVHPQHWPEDLELAHRRVVVIGSGATAVTLLPSLAARAAHVTLLQRSPSYIFALPARDGVGAILQRVLPRRWAYALIRWKNVLLSLAFFQLSRRRPAAVRDWLVRQAVKQGGGRVAPIDLQPRYDPWDQRLCIDPDAQMFRAVRSARADIVTGEIAAFTAAGIRLASGQELPADIVVTATGLKLQMFGGARLAVDGRPVQVAETLSYKGMMLSGVPNLALSMGYTNASWTLKAELIARQACRILDHMRAHGLDVCMPVRDAAVGELRPAIDLRSGYVQRAAGELPRQGTRKPWRVD